MYWGEDDRMGMNKLKLSMEEKDVLRHVREEMWVVFDFLVVTYNKENHESWPNQYIRGLPSWKSSMTGESLLEMLA